MIEISLSIDDVAHIIALVKLALGFSKDVGATDERIAMLERLLANLEFQCGIIPDASQVLS